MRLLKERPVARQRDLKLEEPPNRWQLFVTWLLESLTPAAPVVSTFGVCSQKSPASIWRGVVFVVLVVGLMAMGRVAFAEPYLVEYTDKSDTISLEARGTIFKVGSCDSDSNLACLPANCELDTNRMHRETTGLGTVGDPGYGIFISNINHPRGGYITDTLSKKDNGEWCLTTSVKVCPERKQRAWYTGYSEIYGKCPYGVIPKIVNGTIPTLCDGTKHILTAESITGNDLPSDFDYKWYRNGVLLSDQTGQSLIVDRGGKYQVSYGNNTYDLGKSNEVSIPQCIHGTVRHDINGDGSIIGEQPLKGITITCDGSTAVTNASGDYSLPTVTACSSLGIISAPSGINITKPQPLIYYTNIGNGQLTGFDFGVQLPASISGKVWNDLNCDGDDIDEDGLDSGWLVEYDDGFQFSEFTNSNGDYKIEGLHYPNGSYTLKPIVTPGAGWTPTSPANGIYSSTLSKYQTVTGIDFGVGYLALPSIATPDKVCSASASFSLSASSDGTITYSGNGVNGNKFNPAIGVGNYDITYTATKDKCTSVATQAIKVEQSPLVSFSLPAEKCDNDADIALNGSPTGGTYTGSGSTFSPSTAGVGDHTITYTYTDSVNSCATTVSQTITVNESPTVTLSLPTEACDNGSPIELTAGGVYSGVGIEFISSKYYFNPANASIGSNNITYTVDNGSCSAYETGSITVNEAPSIVSFIQSSTNKEVTSPVATMDSSYPLPDKIKLFGGGEFDAGDWYYYAGSQKVVVTEAKIEDVTYYTSYESNGCATEAALVIKFNKTVKPKYDPMFQSYKITGTANNQPYSWKITDGTSTLAECKWADAVPDGSNAVALADAFFSSIKSGNSFPIPQNCSSASDVTVTYTAGSNSFRITNPSNAKLYVGLFNQEANCLVDEKSPFCAYNPSIKEVKFACALPPQNMLVQYKLDDNADDTYINNPTSVSGKVGNALSFDGSSYVEIPHNSELNVGTEDFSITAWIKTAQTSGFGTILSKGSETQGYIFYINNGNLGFRLATGEVFYYTSDNSIADNEWHLVTVTVDRDNPEGGLIYVDSNLVKVFDPTDHTVSLNNSEPLRIASSPMNGVGLFQGLIDEVAIFNTVLAQEDIGVAYQLDSNGLCIEAEAEQSTEPTLSVKPSFENVPDSSGSVTFNIANAGNGTMNWTAQTDADWLTINSASSGTNDGTITVDYTANSGDAKTGTITVTADGAENSPQTVMVKQAAKLCEAEIAITPDYKKVSNVDGTTSFEIVSTNGCQAEWTIEGSSAFVEPTSGVTPSKVTIQHNGIQCVKAPCGYVKEYSVLAPNATNSPVTFTLQVGETEIEQQCTQASAFTAQLNLLDIAGKQHEHVNNVGYFADSLDEFSGEITLEDALYEYAQTSVTNDTFQLTATSKNSNGTWTINQNGKLVTNTECTDIIPDLGKAQIGGIIAGIKTETAVYYIETGEWWPSTGQDWNYLQEMFENTIELSMVEGDYSLQFTMKSNNGGTHPDIVGKTVRIAFEISDNEMVLLHCGAGNPNGVDDKFLPEGCNHSFNSIPNNGDGNGDGIQDSSQANVTSLLNAVDGNYLTLQALPSDCVLANVQSKAEDTLPIPDDNADYPYGLVEFEAACETANITVFYHGSEELNGAYRKYGPTPPYNNSLSEWYSLPNATFGFVKVGDKYLMRASFTLKDGELGDDTGVDGIIYDIGGLILETADNHTASGTILDKFGNPLSGVTVQIGDKSVVTDTNGNWEIAGLANGEYTATVTKDGIKFKSQNLVVNGENITLNLEGEVIDPGEYTIYGTIRDEAGTKLEGVEVQAAGQTVTTDAAGNWIIPNLQEGEYKVIASKDSYTFATKNIALGNDAFRTEVVIVALSKLKVTVVAEPRTVKQSDNVTYIITVINGGDETATGITLTDVLAENAGLVSIEALDGGECDADTITCTLPDLTTGNSARIKLVVSNTQANSLLNTATVTAKEYPADEQKTRTQVIPHLSASITDTPEPLQLPLPGEERMLHYDVAATLSANAPSAATDVNLVITLPKSVEMQAINSDNAMCDTSELPTITCQVTDLSVDNADSISHVTVGIDVALKNAGLLALTLEAKLSANEYPVHTDKERTKIFIDPEYKVGLAFVIDDSGSMQDEIDKVKEAITKVIDNIDPSEAPMSVLLTFGDQVKYRTVTQDMTVLRDAVARLKVSGGGTCPEASFEAISFAIPHLIEDGTILFATDASPYEGSDTDEMIARLRSNAIVFNALIFGDCSDENSWNQ